MEVRACLNKNTAYFCKKLNLYVECYKHKLWYTNYFYIYTSMNYNKNIRFVKYKTIKTKQPLISRNIQATKAVKSMTNSFKRARGGGGVVIFNPISKSQWGGIEVI